MPGTCYRVPMRSVGLSNLGRSGPPVARRLLLALLAVAVAACDAGDGATIVDPPPSGADASAEVGSTPDPGPKPKPPRLLSVEPARGAWFEPQATVTISGVVEATTAPVARVEVLGAEVPTSGSAFSTPASVLEGVNIYDVRVESEDDERTVDGRAFFHGEVHPLGSTLQKAVFVHLGPTFLDDDEPDFDDIAGVAEALLIDPEVLAAFNKPLDTEYAILTPTLVSVDSAQVGLVPANPPTPTEPGELSFTLQLLGVHADFDLTGKGGLGELLTGPGSMDLAQLDATIFLAVSLDDTGVVAEVTYAYLDWPEGAFLLQHEKLESLGADLAALLKEYAEEYIKETFQNMVADRIGGLVAELLDGFSYTTTFGETTPLTVSLILEDVRVASHGVNLTLAAKVTSDMGDGVPFGPQYGSLRTVSTPPPDGFSTSPIAFLVDDDVLNQFLFAYWFAGAVTTQKLEVAELEGVDLSSLPKVFQPLARIELDLLLPMTLGPRLLDTDDHPFELSMGDLQMRLITDTGKSFGMSINARTGFDLELNEDGALKPRIDTRPKAMTVAVGCYEAPPAIDPGSVASLIKLGFPPLLSQGADAFAFDLPGLPLAGLLDFSALADKELAFSDMSGGAYGPEGNMLLLEGSTVLRTVVPAAPEGP